jgi:hypothetical protein
MIFSLPAFGEGGVGFLLLGDQGGDVERRA